MGMGRAGAVGMIGGHGPGRDGPTGCLGASRAYHPALAMSPDRRIQHGTIRLARALSTPSRDYALLCLRICLLVKFIHCSLSQPPSSPLAPERWCPALGASGCSRLATLAAPSDADLAPFRC